RHDSALGEHREMRVVNCNQRLEQQRLRVVEVLLQDEADVGGGEGHGDKDEGSKDEGQRGKDEGQNTKDKGKGQRMNESFLRPSSFVLNLPFPQFKITPPPVDCLGMRGYPTFDEALKHALDAAHDDAPRGDQFVYLPASAAPFVFVYSRA